MKIAHVITSLDANGAQLMLYRLLSGQRSSRVDPLVISLTESGPIGQQIRDLGIPVTELRMISTRPTPGDLIRLTAHLRRFGPGVVQTWMYHADLTGGLATLGAGRRPLAWGVHNSNLDPAICKRQTIWVAKACARLSGWLPTRIVCCSESSRTVHAALGYFAEKMVVIPNGFDLDEFKPDPRARESVRKELGVPPDGLLIGIVGRFHPQKDHQTFVRAARIVRSQRDDAHFLLCGDGLTWENTELAGWIEAAGLRERCRLLGPRRDTARVHASLDIGSLTSRAGEAFPLVVGEAMACGVPCVVTDVGDSALIVGETGRVVPPRDPMALASAMHELATIGHHGRLRLGAAARDRISRFFSLQVACQRYLRLYEEMAEYERAGRWDTIGLPLLTRVPGFKLDKGPSPVSEHAAPRETSQRDDQRPQGLHLDPSQRSPWSSRGPPGDGTGGPFGTSAAAIGNRTL
jgi:glycosyltransferase involved in cell wall biosynthesis